jgi:hypothetical protein
MAHIDISITAINYRSHCPVGLASTGFCASAGPVSAAHHAGRWAVDRFSRRGGLALAPLLVAVPARPACGLGIAAGRAGCARRGRSPVGTSSAEVWCGAVGGRSKPPSAALGEVRGAMVSRLVGGRYVTAPPSREGRRRAAGRVRRVRCGTFPGGARSSGPEGFGSGVSAASGALSRPPLTPACRPAGARTIRRASPGAWGVAGSVDLGGERPVWWGVGNPAPPRAACRLSPPPGVVPGASVGGAVRGVLAGRPTRSHPGSRR